MRVLLLMILAVFSLSVSAQTITATGNVKDATGDPIIGASIVEKGNTSNGTITNLDGDFSLKVPANATLIVSYIGMKTQEIAIKGKNKIDVTLSDDTKALDEVVVIGYGTAKRKDITGSVATVSSEVLSAVPVASATEALQGKMAGVQITTTEGSPDAEMKIRVRGGGSITGDNTPLFIVDGFPVESISDIQERTADGLICKRPAGNTYKIQDDAWALDFYYAHKDDTAAQLVNAVLTNTQMWDQDLTKIEGLEAAVLADLEMIRTQGAEAAYKSCL